jgi:ABC-type uncharacterized transport system ATPase subunit
MNVVELKSITKRFGRTMANDSVDFNLEQGEVHAVLGENGAGKSTLMNILSGIYQPDSGSIFVRGQEAHFTSPRDAIDAGIWMIHQHFMLVQSHTVLDNIILGTRLPICPNRRKLTDKILDCCQRLNFDINLNARIWQLSTGEQQRVEIVKALYRGARILILDEPTAILTPHESEALFGILRTMRSDGYSIVFVSHKLGEVLSISDRITVLRKGRLVDTVRNENLQKGELARLMVGRDVSLDVEARHVVPLQANIGDRAEPVLKLEDVTVRNDRRLVALDNVSLTLHSGEILGIAGVAGNGQPELAEVITGLRKVESGSIYALGRRITDKSVREIIELGLAYIPEDRISMGSIATLGIPENVLLKCYNLFSFLDSTGINSYSENLMDRYDVVYSDLSIPVRHLSGGNLQKLILARELREIPRILIAAYPTRGLDVAAIEYVKEVLVDCRDAGSAIILISEDLDELLALSDRIAVIYEGKLTFMPAKDIHQIGLAMAGSHE